MNQAQSGLIFDGNKFACEPTLPFNAMAMPSFDKLAGKKNTNTKSYFKKMIFLNKYNFFFI